MCNSPEYYPIYLKTFSIILNTIPYSWTQSHIPEDYRQSHISEDYPIFLKSIPYHEEECGKVLGNIELSSGIWDSLQKYWNKGTWDCDDDDIKMTYHCPSCNAVVGHWWRDYLPEVRQHLPSLKAYVADDEDNVNYGFTSSLSPCVFLILLDKAIIGPNQDNCFSCSYLPLFTPICLRRDIICKLMSWECQKHSSASYSLLIIPLLCFVLSFVITHPNPLL